MNELSPPGLIKVLVAVKRVVDFNVRVRIKPDSSDVELAGIKMAINPFDENAVEEALRLKERGQASEVVAVSLGMSAAQDVLRHALAMGVDRAILVETDVILQPLAVAKLLKAVVEREQPDLIIMGKQAIDSDAGQAGQMLAALLGTGQGIAASRVEVHSKEIHVTREVDGGTETLALHFPAVVTADLRLNEPRYVKLPNLMMAKKKPIQILSAADLGVDATPRFRQLNVADPPVRKAGIKLNNVSELVEKLRAEAKVL